MEERKEIKPNRNKYRVLGTGGIRDGGVKREPND